MAGTKGLSFQTRVMALPAGNVCHLAYCSRGDIALRNFNSMASEEGTEAGGAYRKRFGGRACVQRNKRVLHTCVASENSVVSRSFCGQKGSQSVVRSARHGEGSCATTSKAANWDQAALVTATVERTPEGGSAASDHQSGPSTSGSSLNSFALSSKNLDRAVNILAVGVGAGLTLSKLLALDSGCWDNLSLSSLSFAHSLQLAAIHNWSAYEAVLAENPVLTKMITSGIVYSLGDWSAQTIEGRGLFDFDRMRILRSGLVGFCLHGSLSHYYYHFCEWLFPWDTLWVVPLKVAFDQTLWSLAWNTIYFVLLAVLRGEKPAMIWAELKATSFPLLQAGWKLWPLAHIITYGVIPVEQRLLWVDSVELVWVTILSTFSNNASVEEPLPSQKEELPSALDVTPDSALLPLPVPVLVHEQQEEKGKAL